MLQVSQQQPGQNQSFQYEEQSTDSIFVEQCNHIVVIHQSTIPIQKNVHGIINITSDQSLQNMSNQYYEKHRSRGNYSNYHHRYQHKKIKYRQKTEEDYLNEQSSRNIRSHFRQRSHFTTQSETKHQIITEIPIKREYLNKDLDHKNLSQQKQVKYQFEQQKSETNQQQSCQKLNKIENCEQSIWISQSEQQKLSPLGQVIPKQQNILINGKDFTQVSKQQTNEVNFHNISQTLSLNEEIKEIFIEKSKQKQTKQKKKQKINPKQTIILLANSNSQQQNSLTNNSKILDSFNDNSRYLEKILDFNEKYSLATIQVNVQFKGPILVLKIKSFNLNIDSLNFQVKLDKKDRNGKYYCQQKYQQVLQILGNVHEERRQYADSIKEANFVICRVKIPYQEKTQINFSKQSLILAPINITLFSVTCFCYGKFSATLSSGVTCPNCSLPSIIQVSSVTLAIE